MRHISIAGLQVEIARGNNADLLRSEILAAKRIFPWVDMILLAELAWFGPDVTAAETLPGPTEDFMRRTAREAGVWLVAGSLYERDGDKIYNPCPVINPEGEVV